MGDPLTVKGGIQPWGQQLKAQWLVLLAAAREGSKGWFVPGGDAPLSHSATFAFSSAKAEGEVQVKPLPFG